MPDDTPPQSLALGRRAPSAKPTLRAAAFLKPAALPQVPAAVNYLAHAEPYGLYMNNTYGVCGPASLAHYIRLVTTTLAGAQVTLTQDDVFALYKRQNPGFDPRTGTDDNGVDMKTMLADAVKHGYGPQKVLGFAEVDVTNPAECRAAVAVFGGLLLGLDLTQAQQQQLRSTRPVWDTVEGAAPWGGHAVMEGAYASAPDGEDCVTWAKRVRMTAAFLARQRAEAYVVLLPEHLSSKQFIDGWDLPQFASAYEAITGRAFPAEHQPQPVVSADDALAKAVRPWVGKSHRWETRAAQAAAVGLQEWLAAKGLA